MDETKRRQHVLSAVESQDIVGLTPPPSSPGNNVHEVRKMVNAQRDFMDSNVRVQNKVRKVSLIAAILLVVFILGLMIGIVVYKNQRINELESKKDQRINDVESENNQSISDIQTRLRKLEKLSHKHRNNKITNQTFDVPMNKSQRQVAIIKEQEQSNLKN